LTEQTNYSTPHETSPPQTNGNIGSANYVKVIIQEIIQENLLWWEDKLNGMLISKLDFIELGCGD
jgi:hypothetical protein